MVRHRRGMLRYHNDAVRRYTVADGPPSNDVRVVDGKRSGVLWVGT